MQSAAVSANGRVNTLHGHSGRAPCKIYSSEFDGGSKITPVTVDIKLIIVVTFNAESMTFKICQALKNVKCCTFGYYDCSFTLTLRKIKITFTTFK